MRGCSAVCTLRESHARGGSGARVAGTRDVFHTVEAAAGTATGPALASVGGAATAPPAIRGLFTEELFSLETLVVVESDE